MQNTIPYISFSFDDFPRSAFLTGGAILEKYGLTGTYYASLGLMGQHTPVGEIFLQKDLNDLLDQGHELGSHTYAHLDAWKTKPTLFEDSIEKNRIALNELLPGNIFKTFSYPIGCPRPQTKKRAARHFICARAGGQSYNSGVADANNLKAYFLEKSKEDSGVIKNIIDQNRNVRGWLIFATHDICDNPTRYGCTRAFFEEIVKYSVGSGAKILPVIKAWEAMYSADL
jgi:peptidoglycan/xylan/chitin deacetylase (PgdA/CDA1 family)